MESDAPEFIDPGIADAEVVELEYAGPRPTQLIGRDARGNVVVHVVGALPRRCYKSGMTPEEAASAGHVLLEHEKWMYWAPSWVALITLFGFLVFFPSFLVGVVLYLVLRKRVVVLMSIRRDIWRRRTLAIWLCALGAFAVLIGGTVAAVGADTWWLFLLAIPVAIGLAIVSATYGRVIAVRKVVNDWAHLSGAGRRFMEQERFDFQI